MPMIETDQCRARARGSPASPSVPSFGRTKIADPGIAAALAVESFPSFGHRHSLSATVFPCGVGPARRLSFDDEGQDIADHKKVEEIEHVAEHRRGNNLPLVGALSRFCPSSACNFAFSRRRGRRTVSRVRRASLRSVTLCPRAARQAAVPTSAGTARSPGDSQRPREQCGPRPRMPLPGASADHRDRRSATGAGGDQSVRPITWHSGRKR
jgi:hypothetical protein